MIRAVARKKDPAAAPPYLSHFHLRRPPFAPDGGPEFFYADPEREQVLNLLLHLTQYSEELLLVAGPAGVGKSALLEKYLGRADEHWQICRVEGSRTPQPEALFTRIAECFRFDASKVPSDKLLESLSAHLGKLHQQMTPVLVIDDAHRLSDDALEIALLLAALEGEHGRLVRVTLFADPSIAERLAAPRFEAVPTPHRLDLKPFDEEQTGAYLNHRLRAAGYSGTTPFAVRHVKRIFKTSHGYPSRINTEANTVLTEMAGSGNRGLGAALSRKGVLAAAGLLLLGLAAYALREPIAGLLAPEPEPGSAAVSQPAARSTPNQPIVRNDTRTTPANRPDARKVMALQEGDTLVVSCAPVAEAQAQASPAPETSTPETSAPEPQPEPETEPMPQPPAREKPAPQTPEHAPEGIQRPEPAVPVEPAVPPQPPEAASRPSIERVVPSEIPGSTQPQTITLHGAGFSHIDNVAVSWGQGARVLAADRVEAVDDGTLRITLEVGTEPDTWGVQVTNRQGIRSNVARFSVVAGEQAAVPAGSPPEVPPRTGQERPEKKPAAPEAPAEAPDTAPAAAPPEQTPPEPAVAPQTAPAPEPAPPPRAAEPEEVKPREEAPAPERKTPPRRPLVEKRSAPTAPVPTAAPVQGEEWVGSRPADHFTVQILAAARRGTIDAYVKRHGLDGPLGSYRTERRGGDLHILVWGDFASQQAAEAAVSRLPAPVRRAGPWVRDFGSVQQEVKRPDAAAAADGMKGAAWVWSRNPSHMTVQLAAASSRAGVVDVVQGVELSPVAVVPAKRNGEPWYLLLYGDYESREAAAKALDPLPSWVKAGGPWIRTFADVHDELSAR